MKTVLVTGGAGYIGSTLVRVLLEKKYKVIVVDNLMFGRESLEGVSADPDFTLIKKDITEPGAFETVFRGHSVAAVVHMAAIVGDPACSRNPQLAEAVNWKGSMLLLEAVRKHKIPRFIFISTCSNYGKMASSQGYVDEASPLAPVSLYAELKVRFEKALLEGRGKNDGFCPIILRFATAYGISHRMRFDLTVNEFTKELALARELQIFGGQFWRPYCHVQDLARAVELALRIDRKKFAYSIFNVGDTRENFQKQMIVDEIRKVIPNPSIKYVEKAEDPRDYRVSFEKIKRDLDFSITRTVPDGIREIKKSIEENAFGNPDDKRYHNG
jgi:nucleoside-diphosphate-sugar epimerase